MQNQLASFSDNKHRRDDVKKGKECRVVHPHGSPLYLRATSPCGGDACEHPLMETPLSGVWEHHHSEVDADVGSSGAAVISLQEQITFPAAKDVLGLNKNGNSQQIELGTGKVDAASPFKPSPVPMGRAVVLEEAEGCTEG